MLYFMEAVTGFTCGGTDILKIIKFVKILLDMLFFIVPMGLIVIIIIDLAKNVIASKDDEMKKNFGIAIKRIIYCVALFLVEPIVAFAIDFIGENSETYLDCIEIAESDEVWKYQIDWDYYPYDQSEPIHSGIVGNEEYVLYTHTNEAGVKYNIRIYKNGEIKAIESNQDSTNSDFQKPNDNKLNQLN